LDFKFNFLESGPSTEVWTYETPEGLAYALPRKNGAFISLLGIISQSKATGKACFWDNREASTGRRITGEGIMLRIAELENGSSLSENCTVCHRGGNAFIIHPKTPLGIPANRDPDVRYTPIGQAGWENPPAFSASGSGSCSSCHEIADPTTSYCKILRQAAEKTMPNPENPVGVRMKTLSAQVSTHA
jgi:hypothetical protein